MYSPAVRHLQISGDVFTSTLMTAMRIVEATGDVTFGGALTATSFTGAATGLTGSSGITGTGALNSGSITSGFGAIDVGADSITGGQLGTNITTAVSPVSGSGTILARGTSGRGYFEFSTAEADASGVSVGSLGWSDMNSSQADKRVALIRTDLAGATANNRGSILYFFTRANGAAGMTQALNLDSSQNANFAGSITGAAISGTTLAASGTISSTATGGAFSRSGATTASVRLDLGNTGQTSSFGVENSTGGGVITGSTAYATVINSGAAGLPVQIGVNSTLIGSFTSTGLAVTGTGSFTGLLTLTGSGQSLLLTSAADPYLMVRDTTNTVEAFVQATNATVNIGANSAHPCYLYGNGSLRIELNSSGAAVTGTLTTSASNGVNVFESPGVSSVGLQFKTNSTNRFKVETPSASADLAFYSAGTTEVARLTSLGLGTTGNVKIGGVPSGNYALHLASNATGNGAGIINGTTLSPDANGQTIILNYSTGTIARGAFTGLTYMGIRLDAPTVTGTGTITDAYQVFIGAAPAATNKYGIYQSGTDANYLAGALTVAGAISASNFSGSSSGTNTGDNTTATALTTGNNYQMNSLGVNTAASGTAGEIRATGNVTAYYSDERLKTRLGLIQNAFAKVCSLDGFYYHGNEIAGKFGYSMTRREVGVSAQQVNEVLEEIISPAPIDPQYMTLDYGRLAPLFIEAFKEVKTKIDMRDIIIADLLRRISILEAGK